MAEFAEREYNIRKELIPKISFIIYINNLVLIEFDPIVSEINGENT